MRIGRAEAIGLTLLLGKGFNHANTGDGVGQHAGHFSPHAVDLLETETKLVAHDVDQPHDHGERRQSHQRQPRINRHQNSGRHQDHDDVGGKIQRVQREENTDAVGFVADTRHEIAGALAAKVLQRQLEQVIIRGRTQIGADALADQRQNIGFGPA